MHPLSASELLTVWERGGDQTSVQQAMMLLACASPEISPGYLARLSIGRRDGFLLTLREWAFGPHLIGMATCPRCGDRLEFSFEVADIRATPEREPEPDEEFSIAVCDYEVAFRLINSQDLLEILDSGDLVSARRILLDRCILAVSYRGIESSLDSLPDSVVNRVAMEMELLDPQGDLQLSLSCPSCSHRWEAPFDITSFFWTEIEGWVRHILRDVHTLARAYGWRESDILAMTAKRRLIYMELVDR
jgi:hypothetical protein